ncbi:MAG: caspase family protein [Rhodospirillales bacterium]|jgi:hypothetical protein|nr:caspase family protein [Rhodospirillales bacterium]
MKRGFLVIALCFVAAGCVTTPQPQYVDPLASLGKTSGNPAFSDHRLGVILSDNVRGSMSHLETSRSLISSFGAFTNTTALADADPKFIVEGVNKILTDRFKDVIVVKNAEDAAEKAVGITMLLDMQIKLGPQSGEQTTVKVSGIFVNSAEAVVAQVDGNGASTVPWPASSHMFKPAAGAALAQFAGNLDGSAQLETALATAKPATQRSAAMSRMSRNYPMAPIDVSFAPSTPRPDDIAVVIGNADYGKLGKDIPDVIPAYADAESFKQYVLTELGVREGNIIDLRDATSAQLEGVFGSERTHKGQLYDWTRRNQSRIWVYYSGHGAPAGQNNAAYLVPVDADGARIEINGYPLDVLYRNLAQLPAKSVTVVLEACFSGLSQAGSLMTASSGIYVKPRLSQVPKNLTVITAGGADQVASWENDKTISLFTKYFLTGMSGKADRNSDGRVGWSELDAYLKDTLTYYARRYYGRDQTAQITPLANAQ